MTVLLCEQDDDDDDEHGTTRLRPVRRHNVTTPTMTEINSDDSLYKFIANKGAKSPPCVEGSARRTRKCTAACQTKKVDRCTCTGAAATAATSLCCSDAVQKTYRPSPSRDRGSACTKTAADCRGQYARTGKCAANDNPQCTSTRSNRANEGQCTGGVAGKYGATDNPQYTSTRSYRANDSLGTGVGTGNYKTNNSECSGCGCGCISTAAAAAVAAAACLGGTNALGNGSDDSLVTTACKWMRVAVDWTWDKTSYFFVAAMSFFFGMYTYDWCLCTCEEVS